LAETESPNASVESETQQVQRVGTVSNILRHLSCLGHRPDYPGVFCVCVCYCWYQWKPGLVAGRWSRSTMLLYTGPG